MILAIAAAAVALALLGAAAASAVGARRFRARYEAEKADLLRRGRAAPPPAAAEPAERLPEPVRRYLEAARPFAKAGLRTATLRQRGEIRTSADGEWMPLEAEQAYAFEPPGFVWLARARVAPLTHILARDAFVDGKGSMRILLAGLFSIADARGPEMDLGAGLRHWGEVLAFPEAVRSPYLRWEPVDERRARVVVTQGELATRALVEFGEDGLPAAVHARRYREADGEQVLTPWSARFRGWRTLDGRLFPTRWEATWHLPEGDFEAVHIDVLSVAVEQAAR